MLGIGALLSLSTLPRVEANTEPGASYSEEPDAAPDAALTLAASELELGAPRHALALAPLRQRTCPLSALKGVDSRPSGEGRGTLLDTARSPPRLLPLAACFVPPVAPPRTPLLVTLAAAALPAAGDHALLPPRLPCTLAALGEAQQLASRDAAASSRPGLAAPGRASSGEFGGVHGSAGM